MYIVLSALTFLLVVAALVDIITRQDWQVKHMPKMVWMLLVLFLPLIGSVLWFLIGREYDGSENTIDRPARRARPLQASHSPSDVQAPGYSARPRTTEEQLADLEREIEFHEKQARLHQLKAEVERRREPDGASGTPA
ncbi:PLD nuclease N-terminal domain-containing protein [Mycetocola zhujimingii]|uniref:Cardiolipin synthase N-terminal domain-containing protein n=1 Tax=Mycetocola zhujimingii TaxID=2079792 RepID=A0A2U1TI46_9MICO|nr:PLD nuclease N-terminal domain-containing protein [Mycetocola zhujimingii]AWB86915.1 hypothetical protein C3E77_10005 [Mycetocola zhujimingii]PWC08463.1 hypothetical protein DF223_03820 [Mycetocola zhujimingii]